MRFFFLTVSFLLANLSFPIPAAHAAILFEGWSKVLLSGKHIGYVVQRYEFDEKKKQFRALHLLKTSPESGGLNESLTAVSDASLKPVSYKYTSTKGGLATMIDATFKGDQMTAVVNEGKSKKTVRNKMPKGTFLSGFLGYVMLQGKEGLKKGVKYDYNGIIEESAAIAKGEAYIAEEETVDGIPVFRILNTVDGGKFISLVTHKAETLGTVSPTAGIQTVLVAKMEDAVAGFGTNNAALSQIFGSIPKGIENEVSRKAAMPKTKSPAAPSATSGATSGATPGAAPVTTPGSVPKTSASPAPTAAPIEKPAGGK